MKQDPRKRRQRANTAAPSTVSNGYTMVLIPSGTGSTVRLSIPKALLVFVSLVLFALTGAVIGIVIDYLKLQDVARDYERIRVENHSIRSEAAALALKIREVQASLSQVDTISDQIREMATINPATGRKDKGAQAAQPQKKKPLKDDQANLDDDTESTDLEAMGPLTKEDYDIAKGIGVVGKGAPVTVKLESLEFRRTFEEILALGARSTSKAKELQGLLNDVRNYQQRISYTPTLLPAQGHLTSRFGLRISPFSGSRQMHWGLDISAPTGTPVRAAAAGRIVRAGFAADYGKYIDIDHGSNILTRYAHLSQQAKKSGDFVQKGELIGLVGSTGRSTGPHLHYEVKIDGRRMNPLNFIHSW